MSISAHGLSVAMAGVAASSMSCQPRFSIEKEKTLQPRAAGDTVYTPDYPTPPHPPTLRDRKTHVPGTSLSLCVGGGRCDLGVVCVTVVPERRIPPNQVKQRSMTSPLSSKYD